MNITFRDITYRFPDEALTGTAAPVTEAEVLIGTGDGARNLRYRIWAQRKQRDPYLAAHGCSLCALTTLIGAVADPDLTPVSLNAVKDTLLGTPRFNPLALHLKQPLALAWRRQMPLNVAGCERILRLYAETEILDGGTEDEVRDFIFRRASRGIPILATGRSIPSTSSTDLCPGATHTFLIIGMKDAATLITADSAGLNEERIKFADLDAVARGVFRSGLSRGIKKQQFYFTPLTAGGLLSVKGLGSAAL